MAIEVYKLEVGCQRPGTLRIWRFYWQVSNGSMRNQVEISADIAIKLAEEGGWMSQHRFFWTADDLLDLMRIRRVWPAINPWNDYFYRYRHLHGFLTTRRGVDQARCRVLWFSDRWELPHSFTNFSTNGAFGVENGLVVDVLREQLEFVAATWPNIQTTAHGDQFRMCLLDRFGNYLPVIHAWADPRVYVTNRHHLKG
jgi:hypothetical protein